MATKLKYLLVIPFIALMLWALAWGTANVLSHQVTAYEDAWLDRQNIETLAEWQQAVDKMEFVLMLNPYRPEYLEFMGRLYVWRLYIEDKPVESYEEHQQFINTGLDYMRSSIEIRPTWPLTWAFILELKSLGGQLDDEYWAVWERARQLGRWDPTVQAKLLESALVHWDAFDQKHQDSAIGVFWDMLGKQASERTALTMADAFGALPLFCDVTPKERVTPYLRVGCEQIELEEDIPEEASESQQAAPSGLNLNGSGDATQLEGGNEGSLLLIKP